MAKSWREKKNNDRLSTIKKKKKKPRRVGFPNARTGSRKRWKRIRVRDCDCCRTKNQSSFGQTLKKITVPAFCADLWRVTIRWNQVTDTSSSPPRGQLAGKQNVSRCTELLRSLPPLMTSLPPPPPPKKSSSRFQVTAWRIWWWP